MNVLILGAGAREHALALGVAKSPLLTQALCRARQSGLRRGRRKRRAGHWRSPRRRRLLSIARDSASSSSAPRRRWSRASPTISRRRELPVSGPARRRRGSKARKASPRIFAGSSACPTGDYRRFRDAAAALAYVRAHGAPIVVKADGLAAGKGVVVATSLGEAESAIRSMFAGAFGAAGAEVVVEDYLRGRGGLVLRAQRRRRARRRSPARRTTSASATATRGRTPAAWAPIRRRRS